MHPRFIPGSEPHSRLQRPGCIAMGWYFRRPSLENLMNFKPFMAAVAAQFARMSKHELYRVALSGDQIWAGYLSFFPPGTNPIFKTKTEHDGSYDRHFVRDVGNVVAVLPDGSLSSIWDAPNLEYPYAEICAKLSENVKTAPINGLFRTSESRIGHEANTVQRADGSTHRFDHFMVSIADRHRVTGLTVDTALGAAKSRCDVFQRGLKEITPAALATVIDLMEQKVLYRGEEFEAAVRAFREMQRAYIGPMLTDHQANQFIWTNYNTPAAGLRNTVIGTLLTDLSEGVEVERALRAFEQKVAPTNYKRPTAAITPKMIAAAMTTLQELGLEKSVERRLATIHDISVNNVLWVDNSVRPQMKDGLADLLMKEVKTTPKNINKHAVEIPIDNFMQEVLPQAESLEVFFASQFQGNLMSLTAPVHADAPPLFKWDNNFGWSYNGNITDSIKEKVKAAGGNTNAVLRVSLAWFNYDDLDIHAECPDGYIYFANRQGILDVDMNVFANHSRTPVENLSWSRPKDGVYKIRVHQFNRRETANVGFTIELENAGRVTQYSYPKAVGGYTPVIDFTVKDQKVTDIKVHPDITGQGIQQHKWGVTTEQFVKVRTVLNSPNHWDGHQTGNKHIFFILDRCLNDEPARGIYNEFLRPELEPHRKVFEILGNKTKCEVTSEQLSGLGFSSTKRESVLIRVSTSTSTKLYAVNF